MDLPSIKELNKIIKLCRTQGVAVFQFGELKITLAEHAPAKPKKSIQERILAGDSIQSTEVPDSMPSEEELLFASVGGPPPEMFEQ